MPDNKDLDDNKLIHSLDNEFKDLDTSINQANGVNTAIATANEKLCRSTQEKNPVSRFGYDLADINQVKSLLSCIFEMTGV